MKKLLFIDRDGTIIAEPPQDYQVDSFEKLAFLPDALTYLASMARDLDFEWVMVTNQDGLGTDSFPEDTFWGPHNLMLRTLESMGISWREVVIDRSFAADHSPSRKPAIGGVQHYLLGDYDLANSFVIGDRITDMIFASNLGAKGIFIGKSLDESEDHLADDVALDDVIVHRTDRWQSIYQFLKSQDRVTEIERTTKETSIVVRLNLDGPGETNIQTGLHFFDHMLDQLGKHGGINLEINVHGDLQVDEHHTIEDTALALGTAFKNALGSKRGIERYGFALPMDESEAMVTLDFGGRPWLVWDAQFEREYVGDVPTEMFVHFFKSFSDAASCNLNIKVTGENEHHKIESVFKAFARAIKRAVLRDMDQFDLPSTKGVL
ncbi:MAG: bifunctional histidinol-phosphatase/imidazoleglycerol-phosphate dehydratase HisB [Saprospiraceae bacterium]|nr:bifunctional histidinol-phosphatase/imidazoleglycerol-phosphate dehydratase HisB [Saprospiraceae bacterium]